MICIDGRGYVCVDGCCLAIDKYGQVRGFREGFREKSRKNSKFEFREEWGVCWIWEFCVLIAGVGSYRVML